MLPAIICVIICVIVGWKPIMRVYYAPYCKICMCWTSFISFKNPVTDELEQYYQCPSCGRECSLDNAYRWKY